jgi:hypothetical protein
MKDKFKEIKLLFNDNFIFNLIIYSLNFLIHINLYNAASKYLQPSLNSSGLLKEIQA